MRRFIDEENISHEIVRDAIKFTWAVNDDALECFVNGSYIGRTYPDGDEDGWSGESVANCDDFPVHVYKTVHTQEEAMNVLMDNFITWFNGVKGH